MWSNIEVFVKVVDKMKFRYSGSMGNVINSNVIVDIC